MDVAADSIRVYIFGDEYSIKGDVDIETTKKVADLVDRRMMELQKKMASRDKIKVAVLSALNIAGELLECREENERLARQLDKLQEKTGQLGKKIDDCLQ